MIKLIHGDCLEKMKDIPDNSIDMVCTDPPYGTTACNWDVVIPFDLMWKQLRRITKDSSAIVLFGKNPFSSTLITSNLRDYRYNLIWKKENHDNPLMAKKRFLNVTEDIIIFYRKQCTYNPIGIIEINKVTAQGNGESLSQVNERENNYLQTHTNYPNNIIEINRDFVQLHDTQKPINLISYLIKTYSNEGDTILDFTAGSGTTGVSSKILNRNAILIENRKSQIDIATERINNTNRLFGG